MVDDARRQQIPIPYSPGHFMVADRFHNFDGRFIQNIVRLVVGMYVDHRQPRQVDLRYRSNRGIFPIEPVCVPLLNACGNYINRTEVIQDIFNERMNESMYIM